MKAKCELDPDINKCPHFDPVEQESNSDNSCCGFYRKPGTERSLSILDSHDGMNNTIKSDKGRRARNAGYPPLIKLFSYSYINSANNVSFCVLCTN
jgi:hypothetical protein